MISSSEPGFRAQKRKPQAERLTIRRAAQSDLRGHARRLQHLVDADPLELLALQMAPGCALADLNE
jgi:hypothetical protein